MLRVCGVTFDHTTNYGSCFQAYALQTAIEKIEVGDKCSYELVPLITCSDYPKKRTIKSFIIKPLRDLHRKQFIPFEKRFMKYAPCFRINEIGNLNDLYDVFVCGGDVIWRPDFNFGLGIYYLDFARKYAFSYAASFGRIDIDKRLYKQIGDKMLNLRSLSVRERSSMEIVQCCTNHPVQVVVDPVLLLEKAEWDELVQPIEDKKPYIFVYATLLNHTFKRFIKRIKQQTGLDVIWSVFGPKLALKQGILQVQTPQQWLRLLSNAEFIVTNSFHATVFSVIYHKIFFTVLHGDKDGGINVRMNDFLHELGLDERIYTYVPETIDVSDVSYDGVDEKIDKLREKSIAYLQENLEAAYQQKMQSEQEN